MYNYRMSEVEWIPRSAHSITSFCRRGDRVQAGEAIITLQNLIAQLSFLFADSKFPFTTHGGEK